MDVTCDQKLQNWILVCNFLNCSITGDISESDVIRVTDPSGNGMEFIGFDGEYLSAEGVQLGRFPDPRKNIPQIREMKVNENDVFINAYPKAGRKKYSRTVTTHQLTHTLVSILVEWLT